MLIFYSSFGYAPKKPIQRQRPAHPGQTQNPHCRQNRPPLGKPPLPASQTPGDLKGSDPFEKGRTLFKIFLELKYIHQFRHYISERVGPF